MKMFLITILAVADIIFLVATIYLWRTSQYPGAEIGNMDSGFMKMSGAGFLIVSLILGCVLYFKK